MIRITPLRLFQKVEEGMPICAIVAYHKSLWSTEVDRFSTAYADEYIYTYRHLIYINLWLLLLDIGWFSKRSVLSDRGGN